MNCCNNLPSFHMYVFVRMFGTIFLHDIQKPMFWYVHLVNANSCIFSNYILSIDKTNLRILKLCFGTDKINLCIQRSFEKCLSFILQ